LVFELTGMADG